ncbi:MFS transporter [Paraburkholderia sp. HD33-4]|uniref:MFS transporter n=1 Tax=Paraburkholderia sp. HD33-4 TaxID=2883242 RepID=UPI001F2027D1|nr:MFS transporter [Paraburkholderia sp. HD33-4]
MQLLEQGSAGVEGAVGNSDSRAIERRTISKATKRLVPFVLLCYFVAYLDRTNIGIAALQMNKDIGITASQFGFGAGIFFLMYFSMEVPSNILMTRFGVRRWVARIMFTWGVVAAGMAFVKGASGFYTMRALLGVAEAGFFPAMIFYLTTWFPAAYRARAISYLQVAGPMSFLIGAPISSALLGFDGYLGMHGWQWMFILEAVPAILLSGLVLFLLSDNPRSAKWLSPDECDWLTKTLASEEKRRTDVRQYSVLQAMVEPRVLLMALVHFNIVLSVYGVGFFLPQIVKGFGLSNFQTGLVSAIPYIAGSVGIIWLGRRSDATKERRLHTAVPLLVAAVALIVAASTQTLEVKMMAFSFAAFGAYGCVSAFWTLPSTFLSGAAVAGAIAIISCIGALGGFAGPWVMGLVKDATGSFSGGLYFLGIMDLLAVAIVLALSSLKEHDSHLA